MMGFDFGSSIGIIQAGTTVLSGTTAGILKPFNPSFAACDITGSTAAGNYIIFNTNLYNIGNGYNRTNGIFTAPVAGVYCFFGHVLATNTAVGDTRMLILKNGALYNGGYFIETFDAAITGFYSLTASGYMQMAVNDTAGWYYAQGTATYGGAGYSAFGGYLVG